MSNVARITRGQSTVPFGRVKSSPKVASKESQSFSVIYENCYGVETSLDIIASSEEEANLWFDELNLLKTYLNEERCQVDPVLRFAKRAWGHADSDKSGSLDLKEINAVIQRLNISLTNAYIAKMFAEVDVDNSGSLDFDEFLVLMDKLGKRADVFGCWSALIDGE